MYLTWNREEQSLNSFAFIFSLSFPIRCATMSRTPPPAYHTLPAGFPMYTPSEVYLDPTIDPVISQRSEDAVKPVKPSAMDRARRWIEGCVGKINWSPLPPVVYECPNDFTRMVWNLSGKSVYSDIPNDTSSSYRSKLSLSSAQPECSRPPLPLPPTLANNRRVNESVPRDRIKREDNDNRDGNGANGAPAAAMSRQTHRIGPLLCRPSAAPA